MSSISKLSLPLAMSSTGSGRIASVDQCRGFCILLMIGGNFAGKFDFMPWILTHHKYGMTIAELFAPLFFFLVGFGYRMSFLRRLDDRGYRAAVAYSLRRYGFITVLGLIVYMDHLWDALTHIGMAGFLLLPVIHRPIRERVLAGALFLMLYQAAFLYTGYGEWLMNREAGLNGGPLAALSWGFIMVCGTIAYDFWVKRKAHPVYGSMLPAGLLLCLAGVLLTFSWPGIKEAWPFTRYGMTAPYPVFTAGFSFLAFTLFHWMCDVHRWTLPLTAPIGANPLLIYGIMGAFVGGSKLVIRFTGEPGFWTALACYLAMCGICYGLARVLYKREIRIRVS